MLEAGRGLVTHRAPASSPGDAGARVSGGGGRPARGAVLVAAGAGAGRGPAHVRRRVREPHRGARGDAGGDRLHRARDPRELRARRAAYPVEMVYYDNQRDDARALANAEAAIARKVDLYIQYHRGAANVAVGREAQGGRDPGPRAELPGPGRAALHRGQPGGRARWPGRRWPSSRCARGAASRWRRRSSAISPRPRSGVPERVQGVTEALGPRLAGGAGRPRSIPRAIRPRSAPLAGEVPRRAPDRQAAARRHRRRDRARGEGGGRDGRARPRRRHREPRRGPERSTAA